jgi:beta-lactamase class A
MRRGSSSISTRQYWYFDAVTHPATIAAKADGVAGVTAVDLDTGRRVSVNGPVRFPMASVYKVPVAIAYLQRVDRG